MSTKKPEVSVIEIDPNSVTVPAERLRDLNPAHVEALVQSIRLSKTVTPVQVTLELTDDGEERFLLVAGLHRLEACRILERPVPVQIVESGDTDLLECVENLVRLELTPAERCAHVKLFVARLQEAGEVPVEALVSQVARAAKMSEPTATLYTKAACFIAPAVLEEITGTELDKRDVLSTLSELTPAQQTKRIAVLRSRGNSVSAVAGDALVEETLRAVSRALPVGLFDALIKTITSTDSATLKRAARKHL